MTNNPREQAIETLADILAKKDIEANNSELKYEILAKAILDALNIEVVSKESEPQEWDFINVYGATGEAIIKNGVIGVYNDDTEYPEFYPWLNESEDELEKYNQIIQRNNKPAVYVENIGVKL